MVTVTVLKGFRDLKRHVSRKPGDMFEATEERAAHLAAALPGFVSYEAAEGPKVDYSKLTVAKLKALCEERKIAVPPKAKKADLIALLDKE